jgi:hypothetical protein
MNRIHCICRALRAVTRRAGRVLANNTAAPAILAIARPDPPGWLNRWIRYLLLPPGPTKHPPLHCHVHAVVTGGIPGWQIALNVSAAGGLTAVAAITANRMRASRNEARTRSGLATTGPASCQWAGLRGRCPRCQRSCRAIPPGLG